MSLGCGVDNTDPQILSYIVGIAIYISIGPKLTFLVRMTSFLGLLTLFGCSVWNRSIACRFIGNIRMKTGFCPATRIGSDVSLLYHQGVPDPVTINCKGCD